jgi:hypothetical protein
MSKTPRRLIVPAVVGVSAATLAQFVPGVALAAAHQTSRPTLTTGSGTKPDAAANSSTHAPYVADTAGCTASSSPNYGCGKVTVEAQPVASTYPAGALPDVTGLTFDITGTIAWSDMLYNDSTNTCTTGEVGSASSNACAETTYGMSPGATTEYGAWVPGDLYNIALDTTPTSAPAPADTLIPPATGPFPDCTAYPTTSAPTGCPDTAIVKVYGAYHRVGLHVVNAVTHKAVGKATYELCSATSSAPTTGSKSCPSGSSVLATATTNSHGRLVFSGLHLASKNYSVALTHEPRGYETAPSQRLEVPVVTTAAQSGALYLGTARVTPITTTVKTHRITTSMDKPIAFNALAGAKHVVGPLKLIKVGKAHHGKAHHSGGKITYTPHNGFVGKDVFTYTIRNGVGVTVTGKVIVHVKA